MSEIDNIKQKQIEEVLGRPTIPRGFYSGCIPKDKVQYIVSGEDGIKRYAYRLPKRIVAASCLPLAYSDILNPDGTYTNFDEFDEKPAVIPVAMHRILAHQMINIAGLPDIKQMATNAANQSSALAKEVAEITTTVTSIVADIANKQTSDKDEMLQYAERAVKQLSEKLTNNLGHLVRKVVEEVLREQNIADGVMSPTASLTAPPKKRTTKQKDTADVVAEVVAEKPVASISNEELDTEPFFSEPTMMALADDVKSDVQDKLANVSDATIGALFEDLSKLDS